MAQRLDRGIALQKPTKLSNGWMRIDGRITRTGVFTYRLPDGKLRRELRLPEEVFKADTMQSFALVPVTDEHPPAFLDATNTKEYARGSVAGTLRQDGQFVAGEMLVTDADLIAKLEGGKAREISCGYTCDLEESPGELNGERYDAIQRNIRGNHVAIVERGRAGPEARVRMDAAVCTEDGDPDQPRDESGKWSSTGGGGGSSKPSVSLKSPSLKTGKTFGQKMAAKASARAKETEKEISDLKRVLNEAERDGEDRIFDPRSGNALKVHEAYALLEQKEASLQRDRETVAKETKASSGKSETHEQAVARLTGEHAHWNAVARMASTPEERAQGEREQARVKKEISKLYEKPEPAASKPAPRAVPKPAGLRSPLTPRDVMERTSRELVSHEEETAATFQRLRQLEKFGTGKPEHDANEIRALKSKLNDQELYGKTLRDRLQTAARQVSGRAAMNPRMPGSDS
jgi:hypothetical protein